MKLLYGATRWVLLVGPYAVKVARLRPYRFIRRAAQHVAMGQARERVAQFGPTPLRAIFNYLAAGIIANRSECKLFRPDDCLRLVPVRRMYLGGLILIQDRGDAVPLNRRNEVERHPLWPAMLREGEGSTEKALRQFCIFKDAPHLADYGREDLAPILARMIQS